ncbi:MAG: gluconate 2-dehydrogenase subunit 3 family protein, partial [Herbaspirillum sp.]
TAKASIDDTNALLPLTADPRALSYFTAVENAFLNAAASRLIPTDQLGPGAREAGVVFFIDQQMVGPFGRAERWYMQGPWQDGTKEQGYQLKLSPAQLYRHGIAAVDRYCQANFGGKPFAQLAASQQDTLLQAMEKDKLALTDVPAKAFFDLMLQNTIEGFFADPMYGGNRNFTGWKLIGFPGPRYNYVEDIGRYGVRYPQPPVGLSGRSGRIAGKS